MTFCSFVMSGVLSNAEAGRCAPRPTPRPASASRFSLMTPSVRSSVDSCMSGLAPRLHRAAKLALAHALLKATRETEPDDTAASAAAPESAHQATLDRGAPTCPICGGIVRVTSYLPAGCGRLASAAAIFRCDTS